MILKSLKIDLLNTDGNYYLKIIGVKSESTTFPSGVVTEREESLELVRMPVEIKSAVLQALSWTAGEITADASNVVQLIGELNA